MKDTSNGTGQVLEKFQSMPLITYTPFVQSTLLMIAVGFWLLSSTTFSLLLIVCDRQWSSIKKLKASGTSIFSTVPPKMICFFQLSIVLLHQVKTIESAIEAFKIAYVASIRMNNLLVMITVLKKTHLHNPSNVLLTNLATTDLEWEVLFSLLGRTAPLASTTMAPVLSVVSLITLRLTISTGALQPIPHCSSRKLWCSCGSSAASRPFVYLSTRKALFITLYFYLQLNCLTGTTFAYAKLLHLVKWHRCRGETNVQLANLA